jgi:hypothetical protein
MDADCVWACVHWEWCTWYHDKRWISPEEGRKMDATTDLAALLDEKVNNVLSALKVRKVSDALWARH